MCPICIELDGSVWSAVIKKLCNACSHDEFNFEYITSTLSKSASQT